MDIKDSRPEFSFIVVNYRSAAHLPACFSSLRNISLSSRYECLVANNDPSENASLQKLQARFPFTLVPLSENRGFGFAVNRAAECARGRILVLINPDARFLSGDMDEISRRFTDNTSVGIIGFRLLIEPETPQAWSAGMEITLLDILRNKIGYPGNAPLWKMETPRVVRWVSGAALAVPREVFFRIHGMDERFFLYHEDADFCMRMRRIGKKTALFPAVRVLHMGGASMESVRQKKSYFTSQDRYFAIHRPRYEGVLLKFFRGLTRI